MELIKHIDVFNPQSLHGGSVAVIGLGTLGSAVALELSKLGIENSYLYDFDIIEQHNLPNQILYGPNDIEMPKSLMASDAIYRLTGYRPKAMDSKIGKDFGKLRHDYVFCCVDSMAARSEILQHSIFLNGKTKLYLDGRMNAKTGWGYIFDPNDPIQMKQYRDDPDVMYPDENVRPDLGNCGVTLSIGATAHILAGILVWQFMLAIKDASKVGEIVFTIDPWMLHWRPFNYLTV